MALPYSVTNIRSTSIINTTGQLVDMYEVFAITEKGDSFMIRVPKSMTEAQAAAEIETEARKLNNLHV